MERARLRRYRSRRVIKILEKAMPILETLGVYFVQRTTVEKDTLKDNDWIISLDFGTRLRKIAVENAPILWTALPGLQMLHISDCTVGPSGTADDFLDMLS